MKVAKVNHMVKGLTKAYKINEPNAHKTVENIKACASESSPVAVGRHAVRRILASRVFSTKQLNAAAAPATNQIPKQAQKMRSQASNEGKPGMAKTMPIKAQNTMSWITRGLVSALYCWMTER